MSVGVWMHGCECCLGGLLTCAHAMLGPVHHAHRWLASNLLSGSIPDSIGNMTSLLSMCVRCCTLSVAAVVLACS